MEFALISTLFIMTLMFVIELALVLFLAQQVDYATLKSARQIMTGVVQGKNISGDNFRTQIVCGYLQAFANCDDVIVNASVVTKAMNPGGYYTFVKPDLSGLSIPPLSNGVSQYNFGVQGSYIYLQIIYPITFLPNFVATILSNGQTYKGAPAYLIVSTTTFKNEQF